MELSGTAAAAAEDGRATSLTAAHARSDTGAGTAVVEDIGVLLVSTTGAVAAAMAVTESSAACIASQSIAAAVTAAAVIAAAVAPARRSESSSSSRTTDTRKNLTMTAFFFGVVPFLLVVVLPAWIMVLEQFGVPPLGCFFFFAVITRFFDSRPFHSCSENALHVRFSLH